MKYFPHFLVVSFSSSPSGRKSNMFPPAIGYWTSKPLDKTGHENLGPFGNSTTNEDKQPETQHSRTIVQGMISVPVKLRISLLVKGNSQ